MTITVYTPAPSGYEDDTRRVYFADAAIKPKIGIGALQNMCFYCCNVYLNYSCCNSLKTLN
jgi:hypothetical protein